MRRQAARVIAVVVLLVSPVGAQTDRWPATVGVELAKLSGDWFEVATTGRWSQRRCIADTRFQWLPVSPQRMRVVSTCTTSSGVERRAGRVKVTSTSHPGRLSISFVPSFFAWLPAAWDDNWIVATGRSVEWLLVADRYRRRLSLLSRSATLDEADLAAAIGEARGQGYDVEPLRPVPQQIDGRRPVPDRSASLRW